jgi:hypothetical protein
MAIIIGDIHGDIEKVQAFLAHKPEAEHVVLGDLVDSRNMRVTLEDELACLDLIFSSGAVLLWGNHDLAYTPERPWDCFTRHRLTNDDILHYSRQSQYLKRLCEENGNLTAREILTDRYLTHRNRIRAAHSSDGWLCTHAGVAPGIADIIPAETIIAGASEIATWLNEEFHREFKIPVQITGEGPRRYGNSPLFQIHRCRLGTDPFGGIFWFDPISEMLDPSHLVGKQIFGHTPVPYPETGSHWVNLNNFEEGIWVFDSETGNLLDIGPETY